MEARQHEARTAAEEVFTAERELEANRRHAMHLLTMAGNARNSTAQAEESLAALEREAERLEAEMEPGAERTGESRRAEWPGAGCALSPPRRSLNRLEGEIAALREACRRAAQKKTHCAPRQPTPQCPGHRAGRRNSLEALIRDHSYATDTVRRLLKPGALGQGMAPSARSPIFLRSAASTKASSTSSFAMN